MLATVLRFNYEKKAKRVTAERLQVTVTTIALTVYSKTRVGKGDFFRTVRQIHLGKPSRSFSFSNFALDLIIHLK